MTRSTNVTKTNIPENISEFCVIIADVFFVGKIYTIGNNREYIIRWEYRIIVSIRQKNAFERLC